MFAAKSKSNTAGNATLRNQPKSSISSGVMMNNGKTAAGAAPRNATSAAGVKPLQQQARAKYAENRTTTTTQSKATVSSATALANNKLTQAVRSTKPVQPSNKTAAYVPAKSTKVFKPRNAAPSAAAAPQAKTKTLDTQQTATARLASSYKSKTATAGTATAASKRPIWNRYQTKLPTNPLNQSGANAKDALRECAGDNNANNDKASSTVTKALNEMAIQSNEAEILNHDLLMGDIKFLLPSEQLVQVIEEERKERHTKEMLKAERKYEPHSMQESQHLSDLKEFLERSAITKKPRTRRTIESLESDRKVIAAMDEMFARALPKTESITNIKERIKRKEHELMSLFETVDRLKRT